MIVMDIGTFIQSTHIFDYNGKEYKLVIKADRSVRLYDSFSGRELMCTDVTEVYPDDVPAGIQEMLFVYTALEILLKE